MFVLVFADASFNLGQGHLIRTLSLARELIKRGARVEYFCRPLEGNRIEMLRNEEINVHIPLGSESIKSRPYEMNSYVEWGAVVPVLKGLAENKNIDWAVVDGYGMDKKFETSLRGQVQRIMVLDDQPNRIHDCDILLDQNYSTDDSRYSTLLPNGTLKLLGPKYALIRSEFLEMRKSLAPRNGDVKRVVCFFGGADFTGESEKSLGAIKLLDRPDIEFNLIIGGSNRNRAAIEDAAMEILNVKCHFDINNMECLLADADLAIGAGGSSTWERCLLGVPALLVVTAENQRLLTEEAVKSGVVESLGWHEDMTANGMAERIGILLKNPKRVAEMSRKAMKLVDGLGVVRVADTMEE